MNEKIGNLALDLGKILFGTGVLGLLVKDDTPQMPTLIFVSAVFVVLIIIGLIMSKK